MNEDRRIHKPGVYGAYVQMLGPDLQIHIDVRGTFHRVEETVERFKTLTEGVAPTEWEYSVGEVTEILATGQERVYPLDPIHAPIGVSTDGSSDSDAEILERAADHIFVPQPAEDLAEVPGVELKELRGGRGSHVRHTFGPHGHEVEHETGRLIRSTSSTAHEIVVDDD